MKAVAAGALASRAGRLAVVVAAFIVLAGCGPAPRAPPCVRRRPSPPARG
jgi:hypothetical protein